MFLSNFVYIYKGHLKSSIKTIFISSIGLIFALAIITSAIVYIDSTGSLIYSDFIQHNSNSSSNDFQLTVSFLDSPYTLESIQSSLNNTLLQRIHSLNLESKISSIQFETYIQGLELVITTTDQLNNIQIYDLPVAISKITDQNRPELENLSSYLGNGTLPQPKNNNQAYLIYYNPNIPILDFHPTINSTINIDTKYQINNGTFNTAYYTINVSGYTLLKSLDHSHYPHLADALTQSFGVTLFVNNLTELLHTLTKPLETIPNISYTLLQAYIESTIEINYLALNAYNANTDLNNFERLQVLLQDAFSTLANNFQLSDSKIIIDFNSKGKLQTAASLASSVLTNLLIYAFPIILVTLFVANYSFGLIHRNVLQHIGIYKTRGATNALILLIQIIDLIFIVIIAIGGGIILGLPISSLILHTDSFLSFNGLASAVLEFDVGNLIQTLTIYGLVLGFLIQILRIIRLAKISIAETENPAEKTEPFWKRHYIDVFLFFSGGLGFSVLYITITQGWFSFGLLLFLGLFLTPIMLVTGTILFFSRMFPIVLNQISIYVWQYTRGLFAFSMKNIIRYKQVSTRAVMLIGILLAFLITFLTIPISYNIWTQNTIDYNLGAEGVVILPGTTNIYFYNATLLKILETNFSQYFQGITPFLIIKWNTEVAHSENTFTTISSYSNSLLAINTSTFLSAADIPTNVGTKRSLENDMQTLGNATSIPNILVQEKMLAYYGVAIGKTITIAGVDQNNHEYKVIDTFSRWSRLFDQNPFTYTGQSIYGVVDIAPYITNNFTFQNSPNSNLQVTSGIYFNFKTDVNQTLLTQILKQNLSLSMTLESQQIYASTQQITNIVMIGQINANIIVSLLISCVIIVMFAWLQLIERRREIFTERTIGMKMYQLSLLFLVESFILLASGVLIGILMGGGLSELFSLFLTSGSSVVPYVVYYPLDLIEECLIVLVLLTMIGAILPAIIVTKLDISHSFTGEK